MNKINAIITSLVLAGGVGAASGMDTYDMVSQEVQNAASQHASFNGEHLSVNLGGFIQTGWSYNNDVVDYVTCTLDASYIGDGWHADAAWIANDSNDTWQNYSLVGTVGYDVTDKWEAFGQYEYGVLSGASENLSLFTVGGNYALNSAVTWTTSLGYSFNAIDSSFDTENTGWRTSSEDGQFLIRSGLTVSF